MIEIVINRCRKGTMFSEAALTEYASRKGVARETVSADTIPRDDPILVRMFKDNPDQFRGRCGYPFIVSVPDGFPWKIMRKGTIEWVTSDA